jgi:hypothetical protein
VLPGAEVAASKRSGSKQIEESVRHECREDDPRLARVRQNLRPARREARDGVHLRHARPKIGQIRRRERHRAKALVRLDDGHDAIGIFHPNRTQHRAVHDAEHRGRRPDADRQRRHDGDGEERLPGEASERDAEVEHQASEHGITL